MAQQRNSSRLLIRSLFAILATTSFIFGGCTDDQSTVGSKFIPENERYRIAVDTSKLVDVYTVRQDSILTDQFGVGPLGSMTNPFLGRTRTAFVSELYSYFKDTMLDNESNTRVLDYVELRLVVSSYLGDKSKSIKVLMHELTENLDTTKTYYSNAAMPSYKSEPIASFTLDSVKTKIIKFTGALATQLGNDLIDPATSKNIYNVNYFRDKFKGYCFIVDPTETDGAFYKVNIATSQIVVHYFVTHKLADGSTKVDTTSLPFYFVNNRVYGTNPNAKKGVTKRFISIKHDKSTEVSAIAPKNIGTTTKDTVFYSSTMGGEIGLINLEQYLTWKDSLPVIFHRVELQVEYLKTGDTEMDRIPKKFGLFTKDSLGLSPIFDLDLEAADGFGGTFDANFRKGRMLYSANITRHFQEMMTKDNLSHIYLIPITTDQKPTGRNTSFFEDYSYGVFRGTTNSSPIKLIITYSKLKK